MKSQFVFVAVLICSLSAAAATDIRQCKGGKWINSSDVKLPSSCWGNPCMLEMWSWNTVEVAFTPDWDTNKVTARVTVDPGWFYPTKTIVADRDMCDEIWYENGTRASCPLYAGTRYTVKDSFLVDDDGFGMTVTVKAQLLDDRRRNIVCFQIDGKVIN